MKVISNDELKAKADRIRYFFTDVDGTLTDGCVYYSGEGELLKKFSLRDGSGFYLLRQAGIKTGIITGEDSPIVAQRADKLKVDKLLMNAVPKSEVLGRFLSEEGLSFEDVAYIGDGINDITLLRKVGLSFAVADADEMVMEAADVVCKHSGGNGAFLEAVRCLFSLRNIDIEALINNSL